MKIDLETLRKQVNDIEHYGVIQNGTHKDYLPESIELAREVLRLSEEIIQNADEPLTKNQLLNHALQLYARAIAANDMQTALHTLHFYHMVQDPQ